MYRYSNAYSVQMAAHVSDDQYDLDSKTKVRYTYKHVCELKKRLLLKREYSYLA